MLIYHLFSFTSIILPPLFVFIKNVLFILFWIDVLTCGFNINKYYTNRKLSFSEVRCSHLFLYEDSHKRLELWAVNKDRFFKVSKDSWFAEFYLVQGITLKSHHCKTVELYSIFYILWFIRMYCCSNLDRLQYPDPHYLTETKSECFHGSHAMIDWYLNRLFWLFLFLQNKSWQYWTQGS